MYPSRILILVWFVLTSATVMSQMEMIITPQHEMGYRRSLQSAECQRRNITLCRVRAPRDVLFLLDASDSVDPGRFYSEMLDYVQNLWCSLDVDLMTRGGVITFNNDVRTIVPLREWSQDEWFGQIEQLRGDSTVCCKCCTPLAEAFREAARVFRQNPSPNVNSALVVRVVFVITDGDPWQNEGSRSGYYNWPEYGAADYRYNIVPQEAFKLKNIDENRPVRILLVGVPNKHGQPPEIGYFAGKADPRLGSGLTQCISRANRRDCAVIRTPPFPIVSFPIEKNLFNSASWNVNDLVGETADDLCEVLPTQTPTRRPTSKPSSAPSTTPTSSPSRTPTTSRPSSSPTRSPSSSNPTRSPSSSSPTRSPSKAPTTSSPSMSPSTSTPSWSPSRAPTSSKPSAAPSSSRPTKSPSRSPSVSRPTRSPTEKEQFDGLDLYLFVDRSKSMTWRYSSCKHAPGSNAAADNDHVCWELFLFFVEQLVIRSTKLKYDGIREIGWQDNMLDKTKGLRIWIYGFACTGEQSIPIVERIAEGVNSLAAFQAALARAKSLTPDGGTCPGAAIERSLSQIMANDLIERPYKAALLLTDGVFYDQPKPEISARGLAYFGVMAYALGIAIPENGNNMGLTRKEIEDQRRQLLAFVNWKKDRVINLGLSGINVLESIAQSFVDKLPLDAAKVFPRVLKKPYYCDGFTNNERCLNTDASSFPSASYCKWIPNKPSNFQGNGKCVDRCGYPVPTPCNRDRSCTWKQGFCVPRLLG